MSNVKLLFFYTTSIKYLEIILLFLPLARMFVTRSRIPSIKLNVTSGDGSRARTVRLPYNNKILTGSGYASRIFPPGA